MRNLRARESTLLKTLFIVVIGMQRPKPPSIWIDNMNIHLLGLCEKASLIDFRQKINMRLRILKRSLLLNKVRLIL